MDLYFCGGPSELKNYLLKTYLQRAEAPPPDLFEHALAQIVASKGWPNLSDVMARAFNFFSFRAEVEPQPDLEFGALWPGSLLAGYS